MNNSRTIHYIIHNIICENKYILLICIIMNNINIIKKLTDTELEQLYWNKYINKEFKFLSSGNQGSVYKFGHYVVKIIKYEDFSIDEFNAIKLVISHQEF